MGARGELLAVLRRLYWYTWQPERLIPDIGICTHVEDELCGEAFRLWQARKPDLFKSWRYYSGSKMFPVPGPAGEYPDNYYCLGGDLWAGRQRMLRRDLLRHIMAEL